MNIESRECLKRAEKAYHNALVAMLTAYDNQTSIGKELRAAKIDGMYDDYYIDLLRKKWRKARNRFAWRVRVARMKRMMLDDAKKRIGGAK